MNILKQAWWAPLALVLAAAELWMAGAILLDRGTSTTQETVVGAALALAGAALAAIWLWALFITPLAVVVIIGALIDRVRAPNPAPTTT